jgi:acetyl-CoA acyltransferase 1
VSFDKVNVNGGAIAIGHPLGCSMCFRSFHVYYVLTSLVTAGARQIATGLNIAKQRNERVFVTSMCIGSGMGMAAVFVSEH